MRASRERRMRAVGAGVVSAVLTLSGVTAEASPVPAAGGADATARVTAQAQITDQAGSPTPGPRSLSGGAEPIVVNGLSVAVTAADPGLAATRYAAGLTAVRRLGLSASSFKVARVDRDPAGVVVRLAQRHKGLEVLGNQIVVRMSRDATRITGTTQALTRVTASTTPRISAPLAARLVTRPTNRSAYDPSRPWASMATPRLTPAVVNHGLVIVPIGKGGRLAYHFTLSEPRTTMPSFSEEVYLDARAGRILMRHDTFERANVRSRERLVDGSSVLVNALKANGLYLLQDATRRTPTQVKPVIATQRVVYKDDEPVIETIGSRSLPIGQAATSLGAFDAHRAAGFTVDYWAKLGRNGWNNKGATTRIVVGASMNNAYWDGKYLVFGTGDEEFKPFSSDVDVVAHEFTHGIIKTTANLIYAGQSGAMNEAYADYFGNAVDVGVSGGSMSDPKSALLGEDLCWKSTGATCALRDLADGRVAASSWIGTLIDDGGVHLNSTIYGGALWDIRRTLGAAFADKIVYRTLAGYLTPWSTMAQGRVATLAAATELGATPAQRAQITAAFDAHGIVDGWESHAPSDAEILTSAPFTAIIDDVVVGDGRFMAMGFDPDTGEALVTTGLTTSPAPPDVIRFPETSIVQSVAGNAKTVVVSEMSFEGSGSRIRRWDAATKSLRTIYSTKGYVGDVLLAGGRVSWNEAIFGDAGVITAIGVSPLEGFKATFVAQGESVAGLALGAGHLAWYDLQKSILLNVKDLTTGKVRRAAAAPDGVAVGVGYPDLKGDRVIWPIYDSRGRGIMGAPRLSIVSMPATLDAPRSIHYAADLNDLSEWGFFAWSASESHLTYLDPVDPPSFTPTTWQVPLAGGSRARVTCNAGGMLLFGADHGQQVVWIDATHGRFDVVRRTAPVGSC